jgi:hypothetical protein
MDFSLLQGAVTSLKTAADMAVAFRNLQTMADVQAKAIELQQVILAAQSSALAAQSEQLALQDGMRQLKEELARAQAWNEERQRYRLVAPWSGAVVYALTRERSYSDPPHWICPNCYEEGRKSILTDLQLAPSKGPHLLVLICSVCKSQIPSAYSGGSIQRKYAEDVPAITGMTYPS